MDAFVKVVELGSYAEAGRALGVTRSAVSKAVAELEHLLGARLLDRTTRRVSATEAGRAYYEQCADILARVSEVELQVARLHDEPRGVLKINAPVSFGVQHLGPVLAEFMGAYPDVRLEVALNDRLIDPIEEGVDVTIRISTLADSSLIARKLAPARVVLVAAPSYLKIHGEPAEPHELAMHQCLTYGHTTTLQRWPLTQQGERIQIAINSTMCSNNGDILKAAALAGRGIAMLPTFLVGHDIKAGRLKVILNQFPPAPLGIYALYAPNRYLAAKTRVLIDFLSRGFSHQPEWDGFA